MLQLERHHPFAVVATMADDGDGTRWCVFGGLLDGTVDVEALPSLALDVQVALEGRDLDVRSAVLSAELARAVGMDTKVTEPIP